jgi:hypothetical protein
MVVAGIHVVHTTDPGQQLITLVNCGTYGVGSVVDILCLRRCFADPRLTIVSSGSGSGLRLCIGCGPGGLGLSVMVLVVYLLWIVLGLVT